MRPNTLQVRFLVIGLAIALSACGEAGSQYAIDAGTPAPFAESTDTADSNPEPDESLDSDPNTDPGSEQPDPDLPTPGSRGHLSPFCQEAVAFQSVLAEIQARADAGTSEGQARRTGRLSLAAGRMLEVSPVQHIAELAALQATVDDAAAVLDPDGWQPANVLATFERLNQQFHLSGEPPSIGAVVYEQSVAKYWALSCVHHVVQPDPGDSEPGVSGSNGEDEQGRTD